MASWPTRMTLPDFNRQLYRYKQLNHRDLADICNAKGLQFAFEAREETVRASKVEIQALPQKPWWPAYVAKRMRETLGKLEGVKPKGRKGAASYAYHGEAQKFSDLIVRMRLRAVQFLQSGYLPAIRMLYPLVRDKLYTRKGDGGARQYGQDKGSAEPARFGPVTACIVANSTDEIDRLGIEGQERALSTVAKDMDAYMTRKMQERIDRSF